MVAATSGLHAGAAAAHLVLKAAGAVLNHTALDVRIWLPGIDFSVRAHEWHHRMPNKNFGQYVMLWDRLLGTYQEDPAP